MLTPGVAAGRERSLGEPLSRLADQHHVLAAVRSRATAPVCAGRRASPASPTRVVPIPALQRRPRPRQSPTAASAGSAGARSGSRTGTCWPSACTRSSFAISFSIVSKPSCPGSAFSSVRKLTPPPNAPSGLSPPAGPGVLGEQPPQIDLDLLRDVVDRCLGHLASVARGPGFELEELEHQGETQPRRSGLVGDQVPVVLDQAPLGDRVCCGAAEARPPQGCRKPYADSLAPPPQGS